MLDRIAAFIRSHHMLAAVMGDCVVFYIGYTLREESGWERHEARTMDEARYWLGY